MSKKIKITFVCTGNTCRSPMAEYIFKDYLLKNNIDLFIVKSAGLCVNMYEPMAKNARIALKQMGIKTSNRKSRPLTKELAEKSDALICMTSAHAQALAMYKDKVSTIAEITGGKELSDPYAQSLDVYCHVAEYLEYACAEIVNKYSKNKK